MRSSRGDVIVTLCDADTAAGDAGNKSHPFVTQDRRVLPFFFISFVKRNRTRKDRRLCLQQLVTTNEADRISLQLKLDCTQRAQSSAKDKISTKIDLGFESGLVRIRIRLSAGSLPKCCVISLSVVKLGRRLSEKR